MSKIRITINGEPLQEFEEGSASVKIERIGILETIFESPKDQPGPKPDPDPAIDPVIAKPTRPMPRFFISPVPNTKEGFFEFLQTTSMIDWEDWHDWMIFGNPTEQEKEDLWQEYVKAEGVKI